MTTRPITALLAACALAACAQPPAPGPASTLAGAWRSQVQFSGGPFAAVRDLQFMYVIHPDGTLTESSNYDAAPPAPPAYGSWRQTGPGQFRAHYEFFTTAAPAAGTSLSGGWAPSGRGLLDETITLSPDGRSFTSSMRLQLLDAEGRPIPDQVGDAQTHAVRIEPLVQR